MIANRNDHHYGDQESKSILNVSIILIINTSILITIIIIINTSTILGEL